MPFFMRKRRPRRRTGAGSGFPGMGFPKGRLTRSAGGVAMLAVCFAVLVYMRVIVPSSFELALEFEVKAPPGVSVEVDHSHAVARRVRPDPYEWEIAVKAKATNATSSPFFVPAPTISFREKGGKRIPLREPFIDSLFAENGMAMLKPGETRVYRTPAPVRIRAKSGQRRVRATISFK